MKQLAIIEANFMFEPSSETWTNYYQFESSLKKYFDACGLEAQIIKTVDGGNSNKRFLFIQKKEMVLPDSKNPVGRPQTLKGRVNELRARKVKAAERDFAQTHQLKVIK